MTIIKSPYTCPTHRIIEINTKYLLNGSGDLNFLHIMSKILWTARRFYEDITVYGSKVAQQLTENERRRQQICDKGRTLSWAKAETVPGVPTTWS